MPSKDETKSAKPSEFELKVSKAIKSVKRDKNGKLKFPDGVSEEVKYAATAEIRRRDTESHLTKEKQRSASLEAESTALKSKVTKSISQVPADKLEEIEDLKHTDPDLWYQKRQKLEAEARRDAELQLSKELSDVSAKGVQEAKKVSRSEALSNFQKEHPELTDEALEFDIPPRLTKRLEDGEITYDEYLEQSHKIITGTKVVKDLEEIPEELDMDAHGGSSEPSESNVSKQEDSKYENTIY